VKPKRIEKKRKTKEERMRNTDKNNKREETEI
jgi:hypothetical protein